MSKKVDRQIELLNILSKFKRFNYQELAQEFDISIKTVKKDISELSVNYPIVTYLGKYGGIEMNKGFIINGYIMKKEYLNLLVEGLKLLQQISDDKNINNLLNMLLPRN